VPPTPSLHLFHSTRLDLVALEAEARASNVWSSFWRDRTIATRPRDRRPLLPLHRGHLGLLLAAGEPDGLVGEGEERHLVRGIIEKVELESADYEDGAMSRRTREAFSVKVKALFPNGVIRLIAT